LGQNGTASMPNWLKWGFWLSSLSYAEIGLTGNEFLAPRWLKVNFDIKEFVLIIVDSSITKSMSLDLWKHGVFVVYTICIILL